MSSAAEVALIENFEQLDCEVFRYRIEIVGAKA
jgi:hypothetical protein